MRERHVPGALVRRLVLVQAGADVVFTFAERGFEAQVRRRVETPGFRDDDQRVDGARTHLFGRAGRWRPCAEPVAVKSG